MPSGSRPDDDSALLLLHHGFDPPILFALGEPDRVDRAARRDRSAGPVAAGPARDRVADVGAVDTLPADWVRPMWRMTLTPDHFRPVDPVDVDAARRRRFGRGGQSLRRWRGDGETPHFFFPVDADAGDLSRHLGRVELVAAAGTHMVVPMCGVCAVGNVYVRRDRRRRGLAARVTSAVVAAALARRAADDRAERGPAERRGGSHLRGARLQAILLVRRGRAATRVSRVVFEAARVERISAGNAPTSPERRHAG